MKRLEKKDKIELVITVFLIVFFIWFINAFLHRKKMPHSISARAAQGIFSTYPQLRPDPRRNKGATFIWEKNMGVLGDVGTIRNPFSYVSAGDNQGSGGASGLSLKGIIWSPDKPSAVINEQTVSIGDVIGNLIVSKITQDSVVLENGNSKLELKLSQ